MLIFSTERLDVRRLQSSDAAGMYAIYGDAETVRWVDDGTPLPLSDCERWIDVSLTNYETRGYGMSAVVERATGDMIGCCGLVHPGGQARAEIKYAIRRNQWGRGFAGEVVPAMLDYGFREFRLAEIIATVDPENVGSVHILKKCGMIYVGVIQNVDGSETATYSLIRPSI